jgi:hypothetical protein
MKAIKYILLGLIVFGTNMAVYSQAKKPSIMIVPNRGWCYDNNYIINMDNQGITERNPDYDKALVENPNLRFAIGAINTMMTERGFNLRRLETALQEIKMQAARDAANTGRDGSAIAKNPLDALSEVAKADLWMELSFRIENSGSGKKIVFELYGIDPYTQEQIAGAQGEGNGSFSAGVATLLQEAVADHLDNFNVQLQKYFDNILENGRIASLRIVRWDNNRLPDGLETEFDGKYLSEIIENWVAENTVQGNYHLPNGASEDLMVFESVRIPCFNADGKAIDTYNWAMNLRKMLRSDYKIESKIHTVGLGKVELMLGGK